MTVDDCAQFGTLATVAGKSTGLDSWLNLPDWLEEGTEATLTESESHELAGLFLKRKSSMNDEWQ